jgi:AAA domain
MIGSPSVTTAHGLHRVTWEEPEAVTFTFDVPRTGRDGGLSGELRVTVGPDEVHHAFTSVSSVRGRSELAGYLAKMCPGPEWPEYVDLAGRALMTSVRAGDPPIDLRLAPRLETGRFLLDPLIVDRHPTVWFGPGGSAKSLLALAAAASIETGYPFLGITPSRMARVLYCDWELDSAEHRDRLERLAAGADTPTPRMDYLRGEGPLWNEADRIRRAADKLGSEFLVVDSISAAIDGALEAAETAVNFFNALRRIGLPVLAIAHQTKADSGDQAPFGSVMWRERARLVYYLRAADSPNPSRMPVAFYCRKNNLGPLPPAVGMTLTFEEDGGPIAIVRSSVTDSADLADRLPVRVRIRSALQGGALTYAEIAAETDVSVNTIIQTIGRDKSGSVMRVVGADGVTRWGLADARAPHVTDVI